ncbi:MAG: DUF2752 domain-containing protein [Actinomycetota bacterium]|nr:DUF2752 domain-containing protein [Actinomycetota bacterium]
MFRAMAPYRKQAAAQASLLLGLITAGAFLAITSLKLPLICPLRRLTGVPCPMCGMTTGTVSFMQGHLVAAFKANPLSLPFVPGMGFLLIDRLRKAVAQPKVAPNPGLRTRKQVTIIYAVAISAVLGAWIFELFRFHVLNA